MVKAHVNRRLYPINVHGTARVVTFQEAVARPTIHVRLPKSQASQSAKFQTLKRISARTCAASFHPEWLSRRAQSIPRTISSVDDLPAILPALPNPHSAHRHTLQFATGGANRLFVVGLCCHTIQRNLTSCPFIWSSRDPGLQSISHRHQGVRIGMQDILRTRRRRLEMKGH